MHILQFWETDAEMNVEVYPLNSAGYASEGWESADFADSALKDLHKAWYGPEGSMATRWYENGQDEFNLIADDPTFRSEDFNSQGWEIVSPNHVPQPRIWW